MMIFTISPYVLVALAGAALLLLSGGFLALLSLSGASISRAQPRKTGRNKAWKSDASTKETRQSNANPQQLRVMSSLTLAKGVELYLVQAPGDQQFLLSSHHSQVQMLARLDERHGTNVIRASATKPIELAGIVQRRIEEASSLLLLPPGEPTHSVPLSANKSAADAKRDHAIEPVNAFSLPSLAALKYSRDAKIGASQLWQRKLERSYGGPQ
jgi:hypothetical protein